MKKYIFIAAAALVAATACSKVETVEAPDQAITFEVASYMTQTRAAGNNFAAEMTEQTGGPFFYCNAWQGTTPFMSNVKIVLNNNQWAPEVQYFWPRTGTIDFFSYASVNELGNKVVPGGAPGTTFKINEWEVKDNDNIMIADAVYNAGRTDHNADGSLITDDLTSGNDSKYNGVPTMFRHLLSQVSFKLGLSASGAHAGTNYEAHVTSAKVVNVATTGSITLTNTKSGSSLTTTPWTPASDGTVVGWTPKEGATDEINLMKDDVTTTGSDGAKYIKLTLAENVIGNGTLVEVLPFTTVLPQAMAATDAANDVEIQITFDLDTKHGDTVYSHEEGITVSAKLKDITKTSTTTKIPSWNMNQKILYIVTIDPVTETLTFDPAVAPWETTVEGSIAIPVPTVTSGN